MRERGGIAILMALTLLTVMAVASLGASQNVVRELSIASDALLGSLASCAAEAGVAWCLAWCHGPGQSMALPPGSRFELGDWVAVPSTGTAFRQDFQIRILCLGPSPPEASVPPAWLWRVRVCGRARPAGGDGFQPPFQSVRELLIAMPPPASGLPNGPSEANPGPDLGTGLPEAGEPEPGRAVATPPLLSPRLLAWEKVK